MSLEFWLVFGWCLLSFHAALTAFLNVYDHIKDRLSIIKNKTNGRKKIINAGNVRISCAFSTILVTYFALGVSSIFSASGHPLHERFVMFVLIGLILFSLAIVSYTVEMNNRSRHELILMLQKGESDGE